MAYTMTHVLVAEKVLEYFDFPIDYSTYMVGAVAPDAVHANPNYSPKLKEKSHLFAEGLKWGMVTSENEFDKWLRSVKEFYENNNSKYDRDFFLGYIVHVLTDICSCREIYAPFYLSLADEDKVEKKKQFSQESYVVNYHLFREFSKDKNLIEILKAGRSYSIPDVYDDSFSEERSRQLLDFEFKNWDIGAIDKHSIVTIENTKALLESAPAMVWKMLMRLGDGGYGKESAEECVRNVIWCVRKRVDC
jgi:hypothetical protein